MDGSRRDQETAHQPDGNREESDVTAHYLRDAIEAALAGETPAIADTPPVGCTVKYRS